MTAIRAESGCVHSSTMRDGGFFLPFPGNKLPDFGGAASGSCHKAAAIRAEVGHSHISRVMDGTRVFTGQIPCTSE